MAVNFSSDDEYIQIRSPTQVDLLGQTEGAVAGAFRTPSVGADDVYIWHGASAFNESIMVHLQGGRPSYTRRSLSDLDVGASPSSLPVLNA